MKLCLTTTYANIGSKCQLHWSKSCNGSFWSGVVGRWELRAFSHFFVMQSILFGLGSGAVCSVDLKYLHPCDVVASAIINPQHGQRQDNLLVVRIEEKRVNRRQQECVVFRCEAFTCEVYCVKRFAKVDISVS